MSSKNVGYLAGVFDFCHADFQRTACCRSGSGVAEGYSAERARPPPVWHAADAQ